MTWNGTTSAPPPVTFPLYYSPRDSLIDGVSDHTLALAAPVLAYWLLSAIFHLLDTSEWKWLDAYRIHESSEVKARNLASRSQVVKAVLFQQVIQTLLGYYWIAGKESVAGMDHAVAMLRVSDTMESILRLVVGDVLVGEILKGGALVYYTYWWAIPIAQLLFGMFIIDTWQYFLHRLMHNNKTLYKHFHSVHHRLYVPYAFGALYNHPVEGFVLDTMGAGIAEALSGMSVRQATFLFVISTFKTVDDHCGYSLPFDPLQWMTGNTADYHDIHHQVVGIKSNFAQPFFTHWDVMLGTRMTRKDIEMHRKKVAEKTL
ncbi:hypothetical protein JAAARDRAFT_54994 [Jaapia argillacea MUCL 33604]|uniref:Fatty acid hydroxylase domain-containing protein n=1 Tax=Jaapia argillacea MUCL 33604 TaxID=933084 RepID=A0A067Q3L0_9AGAM|nr:hypothetical protein JAAARDRAFT_54994 [Jaapia argillacea MUCL 33604]